MSGADMVDEILLGDKVATTTITVVEMSHVLVRADIESAAYEAFTQMD